MYSETVSDPLCKWSSIFKTFEVWISNKLKHQITTNYSNGVENDKNEFLPANMMTTDTVIGVAPPTHLQMLFA